MIFVDGWKFGGHSSTLSRYLLCHNWFKCFHLLSDFCLSGVSRVLFFFDGFHLSFWVKMCSRWSNPSSENLLAKTNNQTIKKRNKRSSIFLWDQIEELRQITRGLMKHLRHLIGMWMWYRAEARERKRTKLNIRNIYLVRHVSWKQDLQTVLTTDGSRAEEMKIVCGWGVWYQTGWGLVIG